MIQSATCSTEDMLAQPATFAAPLRALRDRISRVLGDSYTCVRCGRELVIPQHLDHMELPEGTVCMPCVDKG